jgi:hypothetical protein
MAFGLRRKHSGRARHVPPPAVPAHPLPPAVPAPPPTGPPLPAPPPRRRARSWTELFDVIFSDGKKTVRFIAGVCSPLLIICGTAVLETRGLHLHLSKHAREVIYSICGSALLTFCTIVVRKIFKAFRSAEPDDEDLTDTLLPDENHEPGRRLRRRRR